MRNLNPSIVTAAIALTVIAQPELSRLIEGNRLSHLGGREAIDEYTAFWLHVLIPTTAQLTAVATDDVLG